MTDPLAVPRAVLLPPGQRSRAALGLAAAAAEGRFALQLCLACGAAQYPPRAVCGACLGEHLVWRDVPRGGELLAETTVRVSADPYFRARTPWRSGAVRLDCGPVVIAHLHRDVAVGGRVRLGLHLDRAGQGVMVAMPAEGGAEMADDPQLRELGCDPRGRRVLITDARHPLGRAMASALVAAGAREVFCGVAEPWRPLAPGLAGSTVELDITDETSVARCAAALGGRVEIVINTALHRRPDGGIAEARAAMESACFGPLRLARHFGPALRARAAEGAHPACAWASVAAIDGLAPRPGYRAFAAAQAAGLSVLAGLRHELRPIRVLCALVGPIDDDWHQAEPPPKLAPAAVATAMVAALRDGLERVAIGEVAQDFLARWRDDPDILARERAG